jgi:predicted acyltransferase
MAESTSPQRLVSLDALRGFDMCWILGLGGVVTAVLKRFAAGSSITETLTTQLEHAAWAGFRFYDLIFPLFLFIAGVSMAIALPRRLERSGHGAAMRHLMGRALILVALGVFFSGGLRNGWDKIRWLGVLQRIGIASAAAGMISLWLGWRGLLISVLTLLGGYCLLLGLVPVPGFGAGDYAEGHNLTNYIDSIWLPGRRHDGDHDPEGILSTLPAIATALLGILAGKWITSGVAASRRVTGLIGAGIVMILLGWCWHPFFPIIKKIWSSSFVLMAGGWSAVLLGVFYWIVDVRGWQRWTAPLVWVGANPITLYVCSGLGFFRTMSERIAGHPGKEWAWITSCVTFGLMLLIARWMYKRGIFIKV